MERASLFRIGAAANAIAVTLGLAACGGGGGSAAPAPPPTTPVPAPPPAPTLTPLSSSCTGQDCFLWVDAFVNASGDAIVSWAESLPSGKRIAAAVSPAAGAPVSEYTIEALSPASGLIVAGRPLEGGRYAILEATSSRVRTVDFNAAGVFNIMSSLAVQPSLGAGSAHLMPASNGDLYAVTELVMAPLPPQSFANGVRLLTAQHGPLPFANVLARTYGVIPASDSVAARALITLRARDPSNGEEHVHVLTVDLTSGTLFTPQQVSTQPARSSPTPPVPVSSCVDLNVQSAGVGREIVSWLQNNPSNSACDLIVEGETINASGYGVAGSRSYAITGRDGEIVVVWTEFLIGPTNTPTRLRWKSRVNGAWSQAMSVSSNPQVPNDNISVTITSSPPIFNVPFANPVSSRVMAVAWGPFLSTRWFIGKYVNGGWTVVEAPGGDLLELAINESGQGVAVYRATCGASGCTDLRTFRF